MKIIEKNDLYAAQTTPHCFLVDLEGMVCHKGACDDVSFRQRAATQQVVTSELATILNGRQPQPAQM